MKFGTLYLRFYIDQNKNNIFDPNEPTPPAFKMHLKIQNRPLSIFGNRIKFNRGIDTTTIRLLPYPAPYSLKGSWILSAGPSGHSDEWSYDGIIYLTDAETHVDIPVLHTEW